jgi:hypothetical protein
MPDRDWYSDHLDKNWRSVARRIERGDGDARVGDLALGALAKTVRDSGGLPDLDQITSVVVDFMRGLTIPLAFGKLRVIRQQSAESKLDHCLTVAAEATIVAISRGAMIGDPVSEICRRFVTTALDTYLFGPARPKHVGKCFNTLAEAHAWRGQCIQKMAPQIDHLAMSLVQHSSGLGLRAPRRVIPREATVDMLFQRVR